MERGKDLWKEIWETTVWPEKTDTSLGYPLSCWEKQRQHGKLFLQQIFSIENQPAGRLHLCFSSQCCSWVMNFLKACPFLKACLFLKMVTSVVTGGKVGNPEGTASLLPWVGFLCRLGKQKVQRYFSLKLFPLLALSPHLSFSYLFLSPRLHIMYFFSQMHSNGVADTLKWIATPIQRNMRDKGVRLD